MVGQLTQLELGFILPDGEKYLKDESERGHIEIGFRIINSDSGMKARFEKSVWAPNNPVDFLIFEEGAAKIGNRWGTQRLIQYYPYLLSRKVQDSLLEYRNRNYEIREVYPPQEIHTTYFHR